MVGATARRRVSHNQPWRAAAVAPGLLHLLLLLGVAAAARAAAQAAPGEAAAAAVSAAALEAGAAGAGEQHGGSPRASRVMRTHSWRNLTLQAPFETVAHYQVPQYRMDDGRAVTPPPRSLARANSNQPATNRRRRAAAGATRQVRHAARLAARARARGEGS